MPYLNRYLITLTLYITLCRTMLSDLVNRKNITGQVQNGCQKLKDHGWYIVSHQRDVFPGYRNSGPHCSSGHYLTLEKLPSGDSLYTT